MTAHSQIKYSLKNISSVFVQLMCLFGQRKTDEVFGTKDTVNTAL